MKKVLAAIVIVLTAATTHAQAAPPADTAADRRAVAAIVDSSLAAISRGDMTALTNLMVPEAMTFAVRDAQAAYSARTRDVTRSRTSTRKVTERAFGTQVRVSGPLAMAWAPYDLYVDDAWSHCGVDAFVLVKTSGAWKIASLAYSIEQPPACAKHPDGPPKK